MIQNIQDVFKNDLCCSCGTCVGLCPKNAVELKINSKYTTYEPIINHELCNQCNVCLTVCPGYSVDFHQLNIEVFGEEQNNIILGNFEDIHLAHSTFNDIRMDSSSGGIVTTLLIYALENKIIDGAIVTRMSKINPLEPEIIIAKTRAEIIEASKSKYCPVPVNKILKKIRKTDENSCFAIVGLPCHIHGIRKAEIINKELKEKIVLKIGLFCSHNNNFQFTENLIKNLGIKPEEINKISYRGNGWPGEFCIKFNKKVLKIPYDESMKFHKLWVNSQLRCLFCCDLTSELADISCGDPWIPEVMGNDEDGKTLTLLRSQIGKKLFQNAKEQLFVESIKINYESLINSKYFVNGKKKDIIARFTINRMLKRQNPIYKANLFKPKAKNYFRSLIIYFNVYSQYLFLNKFIIILANLQFKIFSKIY